MSKYDMTESGARIKRQRRALGYTQQYVYEKLDISQNHYSRIENGHIGMSFDILVQLAELLQISTDYILTGDASGSSCPDFVTNYMKLTDKQRQFIDMQMKALYDMELE